MGREKEPFQRHWHSQDRGKHEHDEDEYDLEYDFEDDEYEVEDMFDEKGSNVPKRRPVPPPLPPFPSKTRNTYPRRPRADRALRPIQPLPPTLPKRPAQTTRPNRQTYLPNEAQPSSRRSTGSHSRLPQQTRGSDDFPRRPVGAKPRKRRVWPIFLVGCAAGAVSLVLAVAIVVLIAIRSVQNGGHIAGLPNEGKAVVGEPETQTVFLSALSQLTVCDVAGNISLSVDPNSNNTTKTTITTKKTVYVTDQNEANQAFHQVSVQVEAQPENQSQKSLTCQKAQTTDTPPLNTASTTNSTATDNKVLNVNVTLPPNQTGKMPTVDIAILLPQSAVVFQDPSKTLISMQDLQGNISIDGMSGNMNIHDLSGDITVQNGTLVDGSKLQTQGNLTFNGKILPTALPPNQRASLFLSGEHLVNLTLPEMTSVTLDATSNVRTAKITSDFPIKVDTSDNGYPTYHGPFNPAIPTDEKTAPVLHLQASSGDITIHKK